MASNLHKIISFADAENYPYKVKRAALTSTATDETGVSDGDTNGDTQDITSAGMDPDGGRGVRFDASADKTDLIAQGQFTLEIQASSMCTTTITSSADAYLHGFGGAWTWYDESASDTFRMQFNTSGNTTGFIRFHDAGKSDYFPLTINWISTTDCWIVADSLPLGKVTVGGTDWNTCFDNGDVTFGGLTTVNSTYNGGRIKNGLLLEKATNYDQDMEKILFIGNSFITQGGMGSYFYSPTAQGVVPEWHCDNNGLTSGNGFGSADTGSGTIDAGDSNGGLNYQDVGIIPTVFRKLFKAGIICNDNKNYAYAGGEASDDLTYLNLALNSGAYVPSIVIHYTGTNDAISAVTDATFDTNVKACITAAFLGNAKGYVISTVCSLENHTSYDDQTHRDRVDSYNAKIKALPAWARQQGYGDFVKVADSFAATGGHSITASDWETSPNVHPDYSGHAKIGKVIGDKAVLLLQGTGGSGITGFVGSFVG